MPRSPNFTRVAPLPPPTPPPASWLRRVWSALWSGLPKKILALIVALSGVFIYVHSLTKDCVKQTKESIGRQDMLWTEILERREKFVQAISKATSMKEIRTFLTQRDSLHGYRYADFKERSLGDLEDEAKRNGKEWDEPSTFALRLHAEFIHQHVQEYAADPATATPREHRSVWEALEKHDVSALKDRDLKALQTAAHTERGWLLTETARPLQQGLPVVQCSMQQTVYDIVMGDETRVHIGHRPLFGPD